MFVLVMSFLLTNGEFNLVASNEFNFLLQANYGISQQKKNVKQLSSFVSFIFNVIICYDFIRFILLKLNVY